MAVFQTIRDRLTSLSLLTWLLIGGLLWLVVASVLWWNIVYTDPERVFNAMLKNNFSTQGYTREVKSSQQGVAATEVSQLQTGKQNLVRTLTDLKQQGDSVRTDAISTPEQEYIRYVEINTSRKGPDGKQLDFSSAENVWAKSDSDGSSQTLTQMLFGIVPLGNVPASERAKLLDLISEHSAFSVNYDSVKKEKVNGRTVYTYDVQLLAQPYIEMLKIYGKAIGFGDQVASLNPADYADAQPTNLTVRVDVVSRHLESVSYGGQQSRTEKYSGFGIVKPVQLPTKTITSEELQQRLSTQ